MPTYRGKNSYRTFLKAGRSIAGKIARLDGVIGILGTGSIGRRFGDRFSDLDLVVYAHSDSIKRLRRLVSVGWTGYKGMEFDIPVESFERALAARVPSRFWTQVRRWDHQISQILHDTNGQIKKLLRDKLVYPEREQKELLERYRGEIQEHLVFLPELWASRGRPYNVNHALMRAVEKIVLWIYARNKLFEPYTAKWLFYHLEVKAVPEHVHLGALTEVFTQPTRSISGALRLRRKLLRLCDRVGLKWEINSYSEAHRRAIENWARVSEETRKLLKW
ncbi:MAG: DUF4037 domain-containing protein [Candidatus Zixiibacteriota bacterium]|nr:MAG: DUF4037 domain-containing protein [candidate division Zixibacteria bacterium]